MTIHKVVICLVVGLSLAGCASTASRDYSKANADCQAHEDSGEFKTATARAECYNGVDRRFRARFDEPDLLDVRIAARMAIAERRDRNEITQAQADLEYAQIKSRLTTEEQRRQSARQAAQGVICNTIGNTTSCF
jgi:uncharacterized protein YceK